MAALAGAALAGPLARRVGPGPALIWGQLALALGSLLLPAAAARRG